MYQPRNETNSRPSVHRILCLEELALEVNHQHLAGNSQPTLSRTKLRMRRRTHDKRSTQLRVVEVKLLQLAVHNRLNTVFGNHLFHRSLLLMECPTQPT